MPRALRPSNGANGSEDAPPTGDHDDCQPQEVDPRRRRPARPRRPGARRRVARGEARSADRDHHHEGPHEQGPGDAGEGAGEGPPREGVEVEEGRREDRPVEARLAGGAARSNTEPLACRDERWHLAGVFGRVDRIFGEAIAFLDRSRRLRWTDLALVAGLGGTIYGLMFLARVWSGA